MQSMKVSWKEFSVDLEAIDTHFRAEYPGNYCGNQAADMLELYFETELTEGMQADIEAYWEGIESNSAEAESYRSVSAIKDAIATLKAGLIAKSWDAMSAIERKLVVGQTVTKEELIAAELV